MTAWLCLDDLFLLHEKVLPRLLQLPEWITMPAYGLIAAALAWRARRVIMGHNPGLLILALLLLGLSAVVDQLPKLSPSLILPGHSLIEDGAKLAGILTWLAFWAKSSSFCIGCLLKDEA